LADGRHYSENGRSQNLKSGSKSLVRMEDVERFSLIA